MLFVICTYPPSKSNFEKSPGQYLMLKATVSDWWNDINIPSLSDHCSHFLVDNFIFPIGLLWIEVCKTTLLFFLTEVYYVQIHLLYTRCDVVIKKIFIRENMILIIHEHYMFMINQVKQVSCFYIMGCFRMHNTPSFYFLWQWISVLVCITKSSICFMRVITISITIFT